MKYKFTKNIDSITLSYTNKDEKEIAKEFERDVKLISMLESITFKAKTKLIKELAKDGLTIKDLIIEKKENNKVIKDESNYLELERQYTNMLTFEMMDEICKDKLEISLSELIMDLGLETEEEAEEFTTQLIAYLTGAENKITPSQK